MSQNAKSYLESYIPWVNFLAELLGKNSEIVLHDLTNLDSSILAIRNNYITRREVGAPATDYVLRTLKQGINENLDYTVGYREVSNRDHKQLHSASFYLRLDGELVGMICVNTDESVFNEIEKSMDALEVLLRTYQKKQPQEQSTIPESFSRSIEEMAQNTVIDISISKGVPLERFKQDDKFDVIVALYDSGFFLLKGAVPEIAKLLKISEPTVYRYLQNVKSKDSK